MQTASRLNTLAAGGVRPVAARVMMSFEKDFDSGVDFFHLDTSFLDGSDILGGGGSVVQEWDKYTYVNYSDRIVGVEWDREQKNPWSLTLGIADITLKNHDNYFSPDGNSAIVDDILPNRPVKIFAGFDNEIVQVFVGLTDGMPIIDEQKKTARFHCVDFLSFLFNKPLDEAELFIDQRIDQIISSLLQSAGLSPTQMVLDTAFTTIPYAFFDKGRKVGDALNDLVQADLGRLFLDESGVIRFNNRQNFDDASVYAFTRDNVINYKTVQEDEVYNVVEVKSKVLEVKTTQKVFELSKPTLVPAGEQVEIWADFRDPVTSVVEPVNILSSVTSYWQANEEEDGSGADYTQIDLADFDLFSKSYKMVFENTGATDAYIRSIQLHGTPVQSIGDVYERQEVSGSVSEFEERVMTINNPFIQDSDTARSLAILIATIYGDFGGIKEADVKGTPALQLNDTIHSTVRGAADYFVSGNNCKILGRGFEQTLKLQKRLSFNFFTLDTSFLDGGDVLGP